MKVFQGTYFRQVKLVEASESDLALAKEHSKTLDKTIESLNYQLQVAVADSERLQRSLRVAEADSARWKRKYSAALLCRSSGDNSSRKLTVSADRYPKNHRRRG